MRNDSRCVPPTPLSPPEGRDSPEWLAETDPPRGEALFRLYDDLSWSMLQAGDFDRAERYGREGIAVAEEDGNRFWSAQLHSTLGAAYAYSSRFDSALLIYREAISAAERMNVKTDDERYLRDNITAKVYGNIGNVYGMQSQDTHALNYFLKAKELFERWDDRGYLSLVCLNIGQLYIGLENYDQALINLKEAEKKLLELNDSIQLTNVLDGLCTVYCHRLDFPKALECAELQYHIQTTHPEGTTHGRMLAELSLANAWATDNNFDKAGEYARTALEDAESLGNDFYRATALARLAKYSLYSGQHREGRRYAELSLQADTTDNYRVSRLNNILSVTEFALGNYEKARDYYSRSEGMLEKRVSKQYQQSLLEMEVIYETEKKEMRIAALTRQKKLFVLLTAACCGLALLILVLLLYRNRLHRREKQLIATRAVLDGETAERTRLARDLHDGLGSMLTGVKLNLETVKGGAALDTGGVEHFNNALAILNESMVELRRVAHHLMPESLSRYGLKPALSDFLSNFPTVEFNCFGSTERLDPKMEIMIYRIVHELVNNALKHAGASQIVVEAMHGAEYIAFIVRDDGTGFDASAETRGMGLRNIRDRVASSNGRMEIHSKPGEGTEINIEFRIEPTEGGNHGNE